MIGINDRKVAVTLLTVLVTLLSGCSNSSSAWDSFRLGSGASEVEIYTSFKEMTSSADTVGVGRIVSVKGVRRVGDEAEASIFMAQLDIVMREKLKGPERLTLELMLSTGDLAEARSAATNLSSEMGPSEMLLFLRRKADTPKFHRPVNSLGLWLRSGSTIEAPLTSETPAGFTSDLAQAGSSLDRLLERAKP